MPKPRLSLIGALALIAGAACNSAPQKAPPAPSETPAMESGARASSSPEESEPADGAEATTPGEPTAPPLMPFGVPECDKFVEKYVACVDLRVPADLKPVKMGELHDHRARWRELGKMEQSAIAMSLSCRGVAQRLKSDLIVDYGCDF